VAPGIVGFGRSLGIPVIRHGWLARTLYSTGKADTVIPKASYEAVAHVYAVINELKEMGHLDKEVELESLGDPPSSMS